MSFRYLFYADMGWLWLIGSIKLQVSFAKEPYKRDDILQKRPIILSILLTVTTPYLYYSDIYTIQMQPKIIGIFSRISSLLQGSFAKETYDFIDPANRSHSFAKQTQIWGFVGSLQIQVSFAEYSLFYRALLQMRPCIRSLQIVATPYGVATISVLFQIIRFLCRIQSLLQGSFAKETYN